MPDRPAAEVTVIGAGGIGCALGHALRTGHVDVTFVDADERKPGPLRGRGFLRGTTRRDHRGGSASNS